MTLYYPGVKYNRSNRFRRVKVAYATVEAAIEHARTFHSYFIHSTSTVPCVIPSDSWIPQPTSLWPNYER